MYLYAAIQPTNCNVTRYRKISEYTEIYELIYGLLDEELTEEECHYIAEDVACWCETHFENDTYEHELFTVTIVDD